MQAHLQLLSDYPCVVTKGILCKRDYLAYLDGTAMGRSTFYSWVGNKNIDLPFWSKEDTENTYIDGVLTLHSRRGDGSITRYQYRIDQEVLVNLNGHFNVGDFSWGGGNRTAEYETKTRYGFKVESENVILVEKKVDDSKLVVVHGKRSFIYE